MSDGNNNIKIAELAEAINNKMDIDGLNAKSSISFVIDKQDPTASNNYTWYRVYSDGWVEQGGLYNRTTTGTMYMTLPVEMADISYTAVCSCAVLNRTSAFTDNWTFVPYSATTIQIYTSSTVYGNYAWLVSGKSAIGVNS